jgi:2-iminobutanoate/2-iminopropanoate deaminase
MKEIVSTAKSPKPAGPYSQGVVVGDMVFVAGQVPRHPETGQTPENFEDQVRQVLENIKAILEAAGSSMRQVVRTDVFLSDLKFFPRMNEVYKSYFEEGSYPVRTTVGVQLAGFDVEISCIAHKQA